MPIANVDRWDDSQPKPPPPPMTYRLFRQLISDEIFTLNSILEDSRKRDAGAPVWLTASEQARLVIVHEGLNEMMSYLARQKE